MARSTRLLVVPSFLLLITGHRLTRRKASPKASWEKFEGPAPLGRIPAASASCEGRLIVFGGETDYNSTDPWVVNRYLNDLWMFTPLSGSMQSGRWIELSPGDAAGPAVRVGSTMICTSGTLILLGGVTRNAHSEFSNLGDLWSFDIASKQWTQLQADSAAAGGPGPISSHTATLTDADQDSMLVFGGYQPAGGTSDKMWAYSLSQQTWTLRASTSPSPSARSWHTAVAIPGTGTMYVWGGINDHELWMYDAVANIWTSQGLAPRYASGRTGAFLNGRLYSFGGFLLKGGQVFYDNAMLVRSSSGTWEDVNYEGYTRPDGRCYASVVASDGSLWVYGGYRRPASVERLPDLWRMTLF